MRRSSSPSVAMYSVQRESELLPEGERLLDVRGVQVEVVEPHDRSAALQVEALQLRLELRDLVEELEREAERVPGAQRASHAEVVVLDPARRTARCARSPRAISSRSASARTRNDEAGGSRGRPLAEHERVMRALLPAAEVQRVVGAGADDEPEQIDVEAARGLEVGDLQLPVRRAQDVERPCAAARARSDPWRASRQSHPLAATPARQVRSEGSCACRARRARSRSRSRSRTRSRRPRGRCPTA